MDVHKELGHGLLEIVYKDAIEYELQMRKIPFKREKEYEIRYKDIVLPHRFYADFVVYDSVIVEIKAQKNIVDENLKQIINYLALSKNKVGLIINFGEPSLKFKRVVF